MTIDSRTKAAFGYAASMLCVLTAALITLADQPAPVIVLWVALFSCCAVIWGVAGERYLANHRATRKIEEQP